MKQSKLKTLPVGGSAYLASTYCIQCISFIGDCASKLGRSHNRSWRLTEALVGPSWVDVPLTLKLTPLGAFDLTSILA